MDGGFCEEGGVDGPALHLAKQEAVLAVALGVGNLEKRVTKTILQVAKSIN